MDSALPSESASCRVLKGETLMDPLSSEAAADMSDTTTTPGLRFRSLRA